MRFIGIGFETTFGTKVAADKWFDPNEVSLVLEKEALWVDSISSRAPSNVGFAPTRVTGSVEFVVDTEIFKRFCKMLMGDPTITAIKETIDTTEYTTGYRHEFKPGDTIPSATIEVYPGSGANSKFFVGCGVNSMEISAAARELLTVSIDVLGRAESVESKSPDPTSFNQGLRKLLASDVTITVAGTALGKVQSFSISISNELADAFFVGDSGLGALVPTTLEVTGEMEVLFETWDEYNRFLGSSEFSLAIEAIGPVMTLQTGQTAKERIKIDLPKCQYSEAEMPVTGREPVVVTVRFKAFGPNPVTITVDNEVSGA